MLNLEELQASLSQRFNFNPTRKTDEDGEYLIAYTESNETLVFSIKGSKFGLVGYAGIIDPDTASALQIVSLAKPFKEFKSIDALFEFVEKEHPGCVISGS